MVQGCRRCGQAHDVYAGCPPAFRVGARGPEAIRGPEPKRPMLAPEDEALIDKIIADRYRVTSVLGQGATGTVFGVEHVNFARPGVLKVLRARYTSPDLISRVFYGEARAAWSVTHACVCEVFDIGTLPDGTPYFVSERLEGETLATRIARERMSLASAVDMMMQVLSAIAAIHSRDLLVRDLRPKNIFLSHRRGCRPIAKLLDFGLARLAPIERIQHDWASGPAHGAPGSTQAIAYYLSPERTRGEHGVEPASDLFVAGLILYEALAGERPFTASSFDALLAEIRQGKGAVLHEKRPDVSPELSAFIARALSGNPRMRWGSAKEMQDELRATFEMVRRGSAHMASVKSPASAFASNDAYGAADESMFASMSPTSMSMTSPAIPRVHEAQRALAETRQPATPPIGPNSSHVAGANTTAPTTRKRSTNLPDLQELYDQDVYTDETETKRERPQFDDVHPALSTFKARPPSDGGPRIDEASADNADRTVPPPPIVAGSSEGVHADPSIEIDVSGLAFTKTVGNQEAPTVQATLEVLQVHLAASGRRTSEEEETETMELNPALRARIEQLMAAKPAPIPAPPQVAPPPVAMRPNAVPPPPKRKPSRR
jgi:serine/threonine protein kinase